MLTQRLKELGITLPAAPRPLGAYVPAVRSGKLVFLSGQLPLVEGKLPPEFTGKLGFNIPLETGQAAARQATLNALAILHDTVDLENIQRIVRLVGHVSCLPDFIDQPKVLNAASELLASVFAEVGVHARLALGAISLPLDACVEIELIAEVR